jgi:RND superfamily putative drug exporter
MPPNGRVSVFGRLGRGIARHPWYPIIFWILVLLLALPFAMRASSVTTSNATELPSSYPSQIASQENQRLFPNSTNGSTSLVLLTGPDVNSPVARDSILALARAIRSDPQLVGVTNVTSLYSAYQDYLTGQAQLGLATLRAGVLATPSALLAVNATAAPLWGPAALYVVRWQALVQADPSAPPSSENYPAYRETAANLSGQPAALANLSLLYNGAPGRADGFNGSANCAANPPAVSACADGVLRTVVPEVLAGPPPPPLGFVLSGLGLENYTLWPSVRSTTAGWLAVESGLPAFWLDEVWQAFPTLAPTSAAVATWSAATVATHTVENYSQVALPVPASIYTTFVDKAGNATFLVVQFSLDDSSDAAAADIDRLQSLIPGVLATTDPGHTLSFVQTGDVATTKNENDVLNQDLSITLPATIVILTLIGILYFRSPLVPILTLLPIGVALLIGFGGIWLIGTLVEKVHTTSLTLLSTFVLGVGTDYSVFLLARYREELVKGASHPDAVVTAVKWAGESVATSGATVVLATVVLAFSGAQLLSQWGMILSLGLTVAVLLALTLVPAILMLIGPRIFWPYTGARFAARAAAITRRHDAGTTYFQRAGRSATRRAKSVVLIAAVVSIPLLYIALTVPIAYDYFGQLPSNQPAAQGLHTLAANFGPGTAFPLQVLVTFAAPLVVQNQSNATEFSALGYLTTTMAGTAGVAGVDSPVGGVAALPVWLNLSSLPAPVRAELVGGLAGYLGTDGRTVSLTVTPSQSGLSNEAVGMLNRLQANVSAFTVHHPAVTQVAYGGAPSLTRDLQSQLAQSSQRMEFAVVAGLIVVLLLVLASILLPLLAVLTIGLSIGWAWALTYLVLGRLFGLPLFFYVPVILFVVIMGLGMDYNIFLLTRVREERLRGDSAREAVIRAVSHTGGVITAAAVILAGAFLVLATAQLTLLKAIGLSVALAVLLDAMVIRTYVMPAILGLLGDRVWYAPRFLRRLRASPLDRPATRAPEPVATE